MASSSSTSSSEAAHRRPIGVRPLALVLGGTLLALEVGVSLSYDAPSPMVDKATGYESQVDGTTRDVLVIGTCLAEQLIDPEQLGRQLGPDVVVHDLSTPAGSVLLWTLALKNHVPENANVAMVLLPYGDSDLQTRMNPWESQVMDLAVWGDLPLLVDLTCDDASCVSELLLRKLSRTFRYRGYLGNWIWHTLGTKSLSRVAGQDSLTQAREGGRQVDPQTLPDSPTAGMGWQPGESQTDPGGDEVRFDDLQVLLDLSRERGWKLMLSDLPIRPEEHRDAYRVNQRRQTRASVRDFVEEGGASHRSLAKVPGLGRSHFTDDVHVSMRGSRLVTIQLARLARQVLEEDETGD